MLLILAGVALATLTGDSGILSNAEKAKEQTNLANSKEQVQLAVQGALTKAYAEGTGKITRDFLENELNNVVGTENEDYTLSVGEGPWTVKVGNYVAIVKENGETKPTVDWETILAEANANPESFKYEGASSAYIAIGTDGKPVDMDMWGPTQNADGTFSLGSMSKYGHKIVYKDECPGGKIKGTVPQYIYNEELGEFKEVVEMFYTFVYHDDLIFAPEIPSTVTDMISTFENCTNLTKAPEIPNSVMNMQETFTACEALAVAPEIPSSVTDMDNTFLCCTNLTGTIVVNANPTSYLYCFADTVKPITLTNSATEENTATEATLNNLKGTANNGNVSVVLAK